MTRPDGLRFRGVLPANLEKSGAGIAPAPCLNFNKKGTGQRRNE